jgi:hypothetical protein
MIHHSGAGSQYTSIKFTETVALEGLVAPIGTIGDAYDNAAAETLKGLYKNEAVAKNSPFLTGRLKTLADVEELTFDSLDWNNNRRLHSSLGNMPPEEYESNYYAETTGPLRDGAPTKRRHETWDGSVEPRRRRRLAMSMPSSAPSFRTPLALSMVFRSWE